MSDLVKKQGMILKLKKNYSVNFCATRHFFFTANVRLYHPLTVKR